MTPIVYQLAQVPEKIRWLFYLNPFAYMVWCYQDVFYYSRLEHGFAWPALAALSLGILYVGQAVFTSLSPRFGNAL